MCTPFKRPFVIISGRYIEAKMWAQENFVKDFIFTSNDSRVRGLRDFDFIILQNYLTWNRELRILFEYLERNGTEWRKK